MSSSQAAAQKGPKRYKVTDRWRITGVFRTTTPMHLGSGDTTTRPGLDNKKAQKPCEVQAVVLDHAGQPCMPASAIKGVLRAWAEKSVPGPIVEKLFGSRDVKAPDSRSGCLEFLAATLLNPRNDVPFVPYWDRDRQTGVLSHVCIDRFHGTAEEEKLFFEEYVPEGAEFQVRIEANNCTDTELSQLLAILRDGSAHLTHPLQFGANGVDGWGRVDWENPQVEKLTQSKVTLAALLGAGQAGFYQPAILPTPSLAPALPAHVVLGLTLKFNGPLLVNDGSRTHRDEDDERPHFVALKKSNGQIWLPASSFRGALRSRAEFLANSLGNGESVLRIFGDTDQAARLTINEFEHTVGSQELQHQDFVAIDRFTGGAADGAKFDAQYADRPTLTTTLLLHTDGLQDADQALLAAALHDVREGRVTFGFGGSKGYGEATGALDDAGKKWLDHSLTLLPVGVPAKLPESNRTPPENSHPVPMAPAKPAVELKEGTLVWREVGKKKERKRFLVAAPPKPSEFPLHSDKELKADLRQNNADSIPVQYELVKGQPTRIRPAGEAWETPEATAGAAGRDTFAHAYYFLPLDVEREKFPPELMDAPPVSHARYKEGHFSGTIRVKLTTKTPLLLCDDEQKAKRISTPKGEHLEYGVRMQKHDNEPFERPLLASSSVRGMLRAAYEAVTNSRFGVFNGHEERLACRMSTQEGLGLVPCRVDSGQIHFLPGTATITGTKPGGPQHAAWLPKLMVPALKLAGLSHRMQVTCWVELWRRTPWDKFKMRFDVGKQFDYWKVRSVGAHGAALPPPSPTVPIPLPKTASGSHHTSLGKPLMLVVDGYLCINEYNFDRKYNERIFFADPAVVTTQDPLTRTHTERWSNLIRNYRLNEDLVKGKSRPGALQSAGWSRHMMGSQDLEISDGTLAYARVRRDKGNWVVEELYPVSVSRKLHPCNPLERTPASWLPATDLAQLSPADRVFGWVSQSAQTQDGPAHRSHVRVGPVTCGSVVVPFQQRRTLAILGQPKPQQGRFYLVKNDGALVSGTKEEAGYNAKNRVRGAKVYPHHHDFSKSEWSSNEPSSQNRSITGWVEPGTCFEFDLHVTNLSRLELGALLWLLSMDPGHYLRLGLGKPLGFGSVRAEILPAGTVVADGAAWTACIGTTGLPTPVGLDSLASDFETAMKSANPRLLPSFLKAAHGFDSLPIHYPPPVGPKAKLGEHFHWFTENEITRNQGGGRKLALPDLDGDPSLPSNPTT